MKNLKTVLVTLAKISLSLLIIGYLLWSAINKPDGRDAFVEMLKQPKRWDLLALGMGALLLGITTTMIRWFYLVRAVGIRFSLSDALRIGFLGYLFNFAPTGIAGGDLLKAILLTRENPGNRAKAFASVVVDRIIGLYVLFIVATIGVFVFQYWNLASSNVRWVCMLSIVATLVSTAGIAWILLPGVLEGRFMQMLSRIPRVGRHVESLLQALTIYRSRRVVLLFSAMLTIPVHLLFAFSLVFIAWGLRFVDVPWSDYFAIYPISGMASTIPLPAGPTEYGIVALYSAAMLRAKGGATAAVVQLARQQGLILALAYRLSTILIAPIGAAYYFLGARREVAEVLHDAEGE